VMLSRAWGVNGEGVIFGFNVHQATLVKPEYEGRLPQARFEGYEVAQLNWVYPDDFRDDGQRERYEYIAKMIGFLNSPYIGIDRIIPVRALRRNAKRLRIELPECVNYVVLRREQKSKSDIESLLGRTYDYQWMVSGHYRNQWYPSEGSHKLIWIAPYVKGPEDKPLKQRAYKVMR